MSRKAARITYDEVTRMVKAVRDLGLPINRIVFDGHRVSVVIGPASPPSNDGDAYLDAELAAWEARQSARDARPLFREPKL